MIVSEGDSFELVVRNPLYPKRNSSYFWAKNPYYVSAVRGHKEGRSFDFEIWMSYIGIGPDFDLATLDHTGCVVEYTACGGWPRTSRETTSAEYAASAFVLDWFCNEGIWWSKVCR